MIVPGTPNKRISTIRCPIGVVAAITPWSFPLSMGVCKLGPALAVGCTSSYFPPGTCLVYNRRGGNPESK
ncbi:aldehyde dehydrogenase family protein [Peribacillus frigoritolerans]